MKHDQRVLDAALRQDLASFTHACVRIVAPGTGFQPNWHHEAIAWHLEECLRGNIKRLIITMPPRSLKSISASVAFPAWALGQDPTLRFICVSYAQELALKHARDCRGVMGSDLYRRLFPRSWISPAKGTDTELITGARGGRLATSVGGTLTGRGGDFLVIDDPIKPGDAWSESKRVSANQWYDNTLYSRLDSKVDGVIIIVMQRLHVDDLVGHVLEQEGWTVLNLPAIAETAHSVQIGYDLYHHRAIGDVLHPEREPLAALEQIKATLGSATFSAQYQQAPVPPGGLMVKAEWLVTYDSLPLEKPGDKIIQSWDTASKPGELNDYSVCTTWYVQGKSYYLLDVYRDRLEYPDLRRAVINQADKHRADSILIEDAGAGMGLIQDLKREGLVKPIGMRPQGDKETRLFNQCAKLEAGQVLLPREASWKDDFVTELLAFPNGRHDDQVDSMTQFLEWQGRKRVRVRSFQVDF